MLQAIKALTAALAPKARALRDGKLEQIDSADLVPGDVILMAIGNIVPADAKLLGEEGDDIPMQVSEPRCAFPSGSRSIQIHAAPAEGLPS